jgi:hypothetical protein
MGVNAHQKGILTARLARHTLPRLWLFSAISLAAECQPESPSGLGDGVKTCNLHAYTTDKAKHEATPIRLATDKHGNRPQSIARLELEMPVEGWSLAQFADELEEIAGTQTGEAVLAVYDART